MHLATAEINMKLCQYLLDNGADKTIKDHENQTPFNGASKNINVYICDLLREEEDTKAKQVLSFLRPWCCIPLVVISFAILALLLLSGTLSIVSLGS